MPPRSTRDAQPAFRRMALAPGILAAAACFLGPALLGQPLYVAILFAVSILALIVAFYAGQARHWWWIPAMVAIAVLWNPAYPLELSGPWWIGGHIAAGVAFLTAGALVKVPSED